MPDFRISRRHFFFGSLLAGAVPAAGFGSVASLKALGYKAFSEKLNLAAVGIGGRGAQNLSGCASENVVALCDVDSRQGGPTFKRYEKAAQYSDFRKMLDKEGKNVDAVVISTAHYYHPKGLQNEALLPAPNNLASLGRPDLGSSGFRGGRVPTASPPGGAAAGGPHAGVLLRDGAIFVGDKCYMATVGRGEGVQLLPAARWAAYKLPAPVLPRSPGHYRDWFRACKGGEAACSNFSVAGPYTEWVTLGAIAYRFEGKLEYDAKAHRFTNNTEANQYLKPAFRKGWELKL